MRVYLLRHGQVENPDNLLPGSKPGFPLSERGRRQIKALTAEMKAAGLKPAVIFASPLLRTQQTAEIVSEAFGLPVKTDARLGEWNMGRWEGGPLDDFLARSGYFEKPFRLPGDESLDALADRVLAAFDAARLAAGAGDAIVVSHRESLVAAIIRLQNLTWDGVHEVDLPVASAWEIRYTDGAKPVSVRKVFDHHGDE